MKIDKKLKGIAMQALGVTGGDIAAGYVSKAVDKITAIPESVKPYAAPVTNLVAGYLVASKLAKKNKMFESVGVGMAATGVKQLLSSLLPSLGISGVNAGYDPSGFVGATYDAYVPANPTNNANPYEGASSTVAGFGANNDGGQF